MASITINIPDAAVTRVLDAFASAYNWDGTGTKAAFAKKQVAQYIKEIVTSEERKAVIEAARSTAETTAKRDIDAIS